MHTKGEWKVDNVGRVFAGKELIASINYSFKRDGEGEANSRLIASAPDLLEACKMARQFFIEIAMVEGLIKSDDSKLVFIKQAIAKAEGR